MNMQSRNGSIQKRNGSKQKFRSMDEKTLYFCEKAEKMIDQIDKQNGEAKPYQIEKLEKQQDKLPDQAKASQDHQVKRKVAYILQKIKRVLNAHYRQHKISQEQIRDMVGKGQQQRPKSQMQNLIFKNDPKSVDNQSQIGSVQERRGTEVIFNDHRGQEQISKNQSRQMSKGQQQQPHSQMFKLYKNDSNSANQDKRSNQDKQILEHQHQQELRILKLEFENERLLSNEAQRKSYEQKDKLSQQEFQNKYNKQDEEHKSDLNAQELQFKRQYMRLDNKQADLSSQVQGYENLIKQRNEIEQYKHQSQQLMIQEKKQQPQQPQYNSNYQFTLFGSLFGIGK